MIQRLPILIVIFGVICSTASAHARTAGPFNSAQLTTKQTHLNTSDKRVRVAVVVSDKAAKTAINLLSSMMENVERSAKPNTVENDDNPAMQEGVIVESVEDLDVNPQKRQNRRKLDLNYR